jgi:hypothetical protein
MFATPELDSGGATREAGVTKGRPKGRPSFDGLRTPSTDQAQRTQKISNLETCAR